MNKVYMYTDIYVYICLHKYIIQPFLGKAVKHQASLYCVTSGLSFHLL